MKRSIIVLLAAALSAAPANAQLLNKLADKALNTAGKSVERTIEKRIDKAAEKATNKLFDSAEQALDKQVDKAAAAVGEATTNATQAYTDAVVQSANELNQAAAELNQANAESAAAMGEAAAAVNAAGGLGALYGAAMSAMGVGAPVYTDKGSEVNLNWKYISFTLDWTCKFSGEKCTSSVMSYVFPTEELAIQYYREQIDGLEKNEAKKFSQKGTSVMEDTTAEYSDKDKIAVKAAMQQVVLAMGGKLE